MRRMTDLYKSDSRYPRIAARQQQWEQALPSHAVVFDPLLVNASVGWIVSLGRGDNKAYLVRGDVAEWLFDHTTGCRFVVRKFGPKHLHGHLVAAIFKNDADVVHFTLRWLR